MVSFMLLVVPNVSAHGRRRWARNVVCSGLFLLCRAEVTIWKGMCGSGIGVILWLERMSRRGAENILAAVFFGVAQARLV